MNPLTRDSTSPYEWVSSHHEEVDSDTSNQKRRVETIYKLQTFESPFKRQKECQPIGSQEYPVQVNPRVRKLNFGALWCGKEKENIPFSYPQLPLHLFGQVKLIEKILQDKEIDKEEIDLVRQEILRICKNMDLDSRSKQAELGAIAFFLIKREGFEAKESYQLARFEEIRFEIKQLDRCYKKAFKHVQNNIPAGKVAYLLRTLVRMVVLSNGVFNPGGVQLIKNLLETELGYEISVERRNQILDVLNLLASDIRFRNKILYPPQPATEIETILRIDLKIGEETPLLPVHISWALLLALFSPFGQGGEGNCFAVAAIINVVAHQPAHVVDLWLEILNTASFTFQGLQIPILPLLVARLASHEMSIEDEDLEELFDLPHIQMINDLSLGETFSLEEVLISFRQNLFQQTFLAAMQFALVNAQSVQEGDRTIHSSKKLIIEDIQLLLIRSVKKLYNKKISLKSFSILVLEFTKRLEEVVWLVDSKVSLDLIPGMEEVTQDLQEIRMFMVYSEGRLVPIEDLAHLHGIVGRILDEIIEDVNFQPFAKTLKRFKRAYRKEFTLSKLAEIVNSHHDKDTSPHLLDNSINRRGLVLFNSGENTIFLMGWDRFPAPYRSSFLEAQSESDFFVRVCEAIQDQETRGEMIWDKPLLIETSEHAFNLYPSFFRNSVASPNEGLEKKILLPASQLLEKVATNRWKENLFFSLVNEGVDRSSLRVLLSDGEALSRREVFSALQQAISADKQEILAKVFQKCMMEIPVESWSSKETIDLLFQKLSNGSPEQKEQLFAILREANLPDSCDPLLISRVLDICFRQLGIWIDPWEVQRALCEIYHLPQTVVLGNLNYQSIISDRSKYRYLALAFDFSTQKLRFYNKSEFTETLAGPDTVAGLFTKTRLIFSKNT